MEGCENTMGRPYTYVWLVVGVVVVFLNICAMQEELISSVLICTHLHGCIVYIQVPVVKTE